MLALTNLVVDTYFDAFSRPLINNKHEEKTCGTGPQLRLVFAEDTELQALIGGIDANIRKAFESIQRYITTFREIINFYRENEFVTVESLQTEREGVRVLVNPTFDLLCPNLSDLLVSLSSF